MYKDIKKIKFDKGFTNIAGGILDTNASRFNTTNSKTDTIEITFKYGT